MGCEILQKQEREAAWMKEGEHGKRINEERTTKRRGEDKERGESEHIEARGMQRCRVGERRNKK